MLNLDSNMNMLETTTLLYYVLFSGVFLRLVVDSAAAVLGLLCLIFSRGSKTKSA